MQKISQNKMAVRPVGSLLVTMGFPIMLSMMIQALIVVDSIIARVVRMLGLSHWLSHSDVDDLGGSRDSH